jgi:hypothetical protein
MVTIYILLYIVGAFTTMAVAHKLKDTEEHDDIGIMGLMWPVLIAIALLFALVHLLSYLSILVKKIVK